MAKRQHDRRLLPETETPTTLAETVFYLPLSELREELERFRVDYEELHGHTDLTLRYTSTWPEAQQEWLIEHDARRYFDGLPPFAKAYLRGKMELAAQSGNLDDMPEYLMRLYIAGMMAIDGSAP